MEPSTYPNPCQAVSLDIVDVSPTVQAYLDRLRPLPLVETRREIKRQRYRFDAFDNYLEGLTYFVARAREASNRLDFAGIDLAMRQIRDDALGAIELRNRMPQASR